MNKRFIALLTAFVLCIDTGALGVSAQELVQSHELEQSEESVEIQEANTYLPAYTTIWNLIQTHAAPADYKVDPQREYMTDGEYQELVSVAKTIIKGLTTDRAKAQAITRWMSANINIDEAFMTGQSGNTYMNSYDVYKHRRTIPAGYANLLSTLSIAVGLPAMRIWCVCDDYNAVYLQDEKKWIAIDSVKYKDSSATKYFDMTLEFMASQGVGYAIYNCKMLSDAGLYFEFYCDDNERIDRYDMNLWAGQTGWHINISSIKDTTRKEFDISESIGGISVTSLYFKLFRGNSTITKVSIPRSVNTLNSEFFKDCKNLESVSFGGKIILAYAFDNCTKLEEVIFTGNLEEIGSDAFENCSSLRGVSFPSTLQKIGRNAFMGCDLRTVILPNNLSSVAEYAFYENKHLRTIFVPDKCDNYAEYAFAGLTDCSFVGSSKSWMRNHASEYYIDFYDINNVAKSSLEVSDYSVAIKDNLDLNFYILIPKDSIYQRGNRVIITYPDGKVEELPLEATTAKIVNSRLYFVASVEVAAAHMSDIYSCQAELASGRKSSLVTGSVKRYAQELIFKYSEYGTIQARKISESLLTYGAYSQIYFDYDTDNLANSGFINDPVKGLDDATFKNKTSFSDKTVIPSYEDFEYYGCSLICDSNLSMRMYFKNPNRLSVDEIQKKYMIREYKDGDEIELGTRGDLFYITFKNIPYSKMDQTYDVLVRKLDQSNPVFLKFYPYKYIKQSADSKDTKLKNLCKALYLFCEAMSQ